MQHGELGERGQRTAFQLFGRVCSYVPPSECRTLVADLIPILGDSFSSRIMPLLVRCCCPLSLLLPVHSRQSMSSGAGGRQ